MAKDTFRVVTRASDGKLRIKDYPSDEPIKKMHMQIGVDDCSTDLELRGKPVFRGLIGPIPEGKNVVRYESPEVFESLTKEWGTAPRAAAARAREPAEPPMVPDSWCPTRSASREARSSAAAVDALNVKIPRNRHRSATFLWRIGHRSQSASATLRPVQPRHVLLVAVVKLCRVRRVGA